MKLIRTLAAAALALPLVAQAAVITIQGNSPSVQNCYPFGCAAYMGSHMGFVYKNIGAFSLDAGDTIAFDLGRVNDRDLTYDIWLGSTTTNGGSTLAGAMTKVVTSGTGTGRGNTVVGDFDVVFTLNSSFNFAGGGLAVAFSARGTTAGDNTTEQNLVYSNASDSSNYFVGRFWGVNSLTPNANLFTAGSHDNMWVGHMRINPDVASAQVPEPGTLALAGLALLGAAAARRRRTA